MKGLKIITQQEGGKITTGIINQRNDLDAEKTVTYWVFKCQKAGLMIAHVCYGKGKVFSNWHVKEPLKIDLEAYSC